MAYRQTDRCLAKLGPEEPCFVLDGRWKGSPGLVRLWGCLAAEHGIVAARAVEAIACAAEMETYIGIRSWHAAPIYGRGPDCALGLPLPLTVPIFALRAQDRLAPIIVRTWARIAQVKDAGVTVVGDVLLFAEEMERLTPRRWPD